MVVRWRFDDVFQQGPSPYSWTFTLNPNDGGALSMSREVQTQRTVGNRGGVAMEGDVSASVLSFSGVILTQGHFEAFESWHMRRVLIELTDDLGRTYRGILSAFNPTRQRRARNFWYHTYEAQFTVLAYKSASGVVHYGRF